jgi:signal transduction histidine kinase
MIDEELTFEAAAAIGCEHARECPISKSACPGECIYADVMESQNLGVVVFDLGQAAVVFANRSARELLERLGQPVDYAALHQLLLSSSGTAGGAGTQPHPDSVRIGQRLIGYTAYRARAFAWVFVKDITEKRRLESIAEAVETMNNIGYIFAAVRHELGNPINSVKAAISVVRANLASYSQETVAEYLDRIAAEIGRVETLLKSLRSFSLYERPDIRRTDVGQVVADFAALVGDEARKREVRLEVESGAPCWAACDPRALHQVLLNLFTNSADALRDRPDRSIRIGVGRADQLVCLTVVDTGQGLDAEQLRNLFKPFYTSKASGTGLGLVIARKMLAKMGGTIGVESTEGVGTSVTITLPAAEAAA